MFTASIGWHCFSSQAFSPSSEVSENNEKIWKVVFLRTQKMKWLRQTWRKELHQKNQKRFQCSVILQLHRQSNDHKCPNLHERLTIKGHGDPGPGTGWCEQFSFKPLLQKSTFDSSALFVVIMQKIVPIWRPFCRSPVIQLVQLFLHLALSFAKLLLVCPWC